jgi:SAM-dependent methyltransferase
VPAFARLRRRLRAGLARRLYTARPRGWLARRRLRAGGSLTARERGLARRVSTRISHRDAMHGVGGPYYFAVGLSALRCVEAALAASGRHSVDTILDLPCGHGRVLRWLAAAFPTARLTACDLDRDGVGYCARAFEAAAAYSIADFDRLELGSRFDLIWCGSLVTHIDADRISALLRFFERHLAPAGLLVLTSHGAGAAERMRHRRLDYRLTPDQLDAVLQGHAQEGFAYADYPGETGYGVSLALPAWVRAQATRATGLQEVYFRERGWDDHQDVFGFVAGAGARGG